MHIKYVYIILYLWLTDTTAACESSRKVQKHIYVYANVLRTRKYIPRKQAVRRCVCERAAQLHSTIAEVNAVCTWEKKREIQKNRALLLCDVEIILCMSKVLLSYKSQLYFY